MTTCTAAAAPSSTVVAQLESVASPLLVQELALMRSGPASAPELPPPRA